MAVLHYSRNPNPRLAVAVARHLKAPVTLSFAQIFHPDHAARFIQLNPNQRLPILEEAGGSLWESDAIACRLSQMVQSDFWRLGAEQPEMIRWISWGKEHFVMACDMVHFELGTKRRYDLGPTDRAQVDEGLRRFHRSAAILDRHLTGRDWLVGHGPSHADFRMATFLPFDDVMRLPLADYPAVAALERPDEPPSGLGRPFCRAGCPAASACLTLASARRLGHHGAHLRDHDHEQPPDFRRDR